ncbi:hypothetical protein K469DRAFT_558641 [Zopfia rhizophila CBS 207.26]|uniref:Uncharacterized protein n=1 Tax=Zopfia rhizophila CBS 207.26 TaxID=1314779 RepID=A0A6A6EJS7_9PEZI|nr:hypothetical protein K469DRAFT_558641 [Zopfia rhizophila CBS 207.26]
MQPFGAVIVGKRHQKQELAPHIRAAILSSVENRVPKTKIARIYHVGRQTVYDTIKRWNETTKIRSAPQASRQRKLSPRDKAKILHIVRQYPRVEYARLKLLVRGINVSNYTLYRLLKGSRDYELGSQTTSKTHTKRCKNLP